MTKEKNISKIDILSLYMDFVTENQTKPVDIEDFCQRVNLEETDFYKHFKSLKKVEKAIFKELFTNSLEVLSESEEFISFDKKNKLISFYFTFFENLNLNRAYILIALKGCENKLKSFEHKELMDCLKQQNETDRTILAMKGAGHDYAVIQKFIGKISMGNLRTKTTRARTLLADCLGRKRK